MDDERKESWTEKCCDNPNFVIQWRPTLNNGIRVSASLRAEANSFSYHSHTTSLRSRLNRRLFHCSTMMLAARAQLDEKGEQPCSRVVLVENGQRLLHKTHRKAVWVVRLR